MKPITKITKYWSIQKILQEVPGSVDCMVEFGIDCFSCNADKTETLEEGVKSHGFKDDDVTKLVDNINQSWSAYLLKNYQKPSQADYQLEVIEEGNKTYHKIAGIMFTEKAYQAILNLNTDNSEFFILELTSGGCSGYSYEYKYSNQNTLSEPILFQISPTLKLATNLFTFDKLKGSTVDFESGLKGSGLIFINPNSKANCHCGVSVGF